MKKIFGNIINPINKHKTEIIKDGCLIINNKGIIEKKGKKVNFEEIKCEIFDFNDNFLIPGFIDIHTHIPQYPLIGKGKGELLDWLRKYIFPAEIKFNSADYAEKVFEYFCHNSLRFGTTTSVAFSSIHRSALKRIIEKNHKLRLFAGNSLMDLGEGELVKPMQHNLSVMNDLFQKSLNNAHFNYTVSPRYAASCSIDLMKNAAEFAKENNLYIQTHLSENKSEIEHILNIHRDYTNYTDIYHKTGLLTDKTILAHCIHLSEKELEIIHNTGAVIAHCPSSNSYLKSGIMPLKKYIQNEMKVGLGTDVAAGYTLDMKTEMRNAIESSKTLSYFTNEDHAVSALEVFPMSNILAAEYLGIADITGNLNEGKYADITVIQNRNSSEITEDILSEIIYGEDKNNLATFYKGERVY
jgi:guanine deaminase